jgi:hypothetical protein
MSLRASRTSSWRGCVVATLGLTAYAASTTACGYVQITENRTMTYKNADGTTTVKHEHWQGSLDQLPSHLNEEWSAAAGQLTSITGRLVKELTDVPPPGTVRLGQLGAGLDKFEGNAQTDFLMHATDDRGNPIPFQYVQLGVPSYDNFFKKAQEVYALCYQAKQTLKRTVDLTSKMLNEKIEAGAALNASVSKALGQSNADATAVAQLTSARDLSVSLAPLIAQIGKEIAQLVSAGQQLIVSAPTSLTNPKVVLHLGLVKKGLGASVNVIKESGNVLAAFSGDFASFTSSSN